MSHIEKHAHVKTVWLTTSNYERWKTFIMERAMDYGEPGRALRALQPAAIREPTREDRKHRTTDEVIDEAEYIAILVERIGEEGDINVQNDIEAALRREYPVVYRSDIQFEETYKRYFRKLEEIERESPKLISYILSTISDEAKSKLQSQPNYARANNTYNPLLLWNTIEQVFALQGRYSDVTIRTKYINYFQKEDSFDVYVVKTKEMLETLQGLGIVYDNASIVTQFLTRMVAVCDYGTTKYIYY